jgi:uncharacterized OB-fold protein
MEIPRHWRLKAQRYRLEGSNCPTCGRLTFPPRPMCPHCAFQSAWADVSELTVLSKPIGLTNIEPQIRFQIIER